MRQHNRRGAAGFDHGPAEPDSVGAGLAIAGMRSGYGKRDVFEGLSLQSLQAGQVAAVLGPNGCGKSTLLKTVAGLMPMRGGAIALDGQPLSGLPPAARAGLVAYMPQDLPAAVHLRVLEAVVAASRAAPHRRNGLLDAVPAGYGRPGEPTDAAPALAHARSGPSDAGPDLSSSRGGASDTELAQALLWRLGIGHLALNYLDELSGGQRQLAGLALALIRAPRILLLDEPLSALDLRHQFEVMDLLTRETRERGLITLMALHDLNIALRHTDRAVLLHAGTLAAEGAPADVVRPDTLAAVYGVQGRVARCDQGRPYVMIDGVLDAKPWS